MTTPDPGTLTAFVRARLDEDEATARATTRHQPYDEWDAVGAGTQDDVHRSHWEVVRIARPHPNPAAYDIATHIARHDPARVLREVVAKRRIVERYAWLREHGDTGDAAWVLPLLALPYADHTDHRQEWRP